MGSTVLDTSFADQSLQPGRQVPRPEAVQADRRRAAVLPRRLLLDARRLHAAVDQHRRLSGHSAADCRTATPPRTCRGSRRSPRSKAGIRCTAASTSGAPQRDRTGGGNRSGQLTFDRTLHAAVQRREHADAEQPRAVAGRLRAGAADLGVDQRRAALDASATTGRPPSARTPGVSADLTINVGLRFEYETGVKREGRPHDRRLGSDGQDRDHRRRAGGVPGERPAEPGRHAGDAQRRSAARSTPATSGVSQPAEAMWMPRVSASYLIDERTVLKGGYGLYYDTLTAADYFAGADRLQRHDDVDDLRRFGPHVQVGDAGDRQRELRSVPGARRRHPLGSDPRRHARHQLGARRHPHHRERPAQARAAAALAGVAPARADVEPQRRSRLHRRLQRPSAGQHPRRLPAGAVLGREQHAEHRGERLPDGERDQPVPHQQLCLAEDHRPGALSAARVEPDVLVGDDSAPAPAASVRRS